MSDYDTDSLTAATYDWRYAVNNDDTTRSLKEHIVFEQYYQDEPPIVEIDCSELRPGDTLVGDAGGLLFVSGEVYRSSDPMGFYNVEVEFGTLRLDADLPVSIVDRSVTLPR